MSELRRIGEGVSGWLIEFSPKEEHWVDFKAWQIVGFKGATEADGFLFGGVGRFDTERREEDLCAEGFVKWDGCSEWRWPNDDWHLCGVEGAKERVALFRAVYEYAAEHYKPSSMSDCLKW